jgi:hypothetical protein
MIITRITTHEFLAEGLIVYEGTCTVTNETICAGAVLNGHLPAPKKGHRRRTLKWEEETADSESVAFENGCQSSKVTFRIEDRKP